MALFLVAEFLITLITFHWNKYFSLSKFTNKIKFPIHHTRNLLFILQYLLSIWRQFEAHLSITFDFLMFQSFPLRMLAYALFFSFLIQCPWLLDELYLCYFFNLLLAIPSVRALFSSRVTLSRDRSSRRSGAIAGKPSVRGHRVFHEPRELFIANQFVLSFLSGTTKWEIALPLVAACIRISRSNSGLTYITDIPNVCSVTWDGNRCAPDIWTNNTHVHVHIHNAYVFQIHTYTHRWT